MQQDSMAVNNKREIFGWAMYDWANSAFSTTIVTVFLGPYLASLVSKAAESYPDGMARLAGILPAYPGCHRRLFTPPQADDAAVRYLWRVGYHLTILHYRSGLVVRW